MRSAMDVLSDSIKRLEENGRRMLAEIERLRADNERLRAYLSQWSANDMTALQLLEENERLKKLALSLKADADYRDGENGRLRAALIPAEEWMAEDGCDCGTDEPGTCALCLVRGVLRGAK